MQSRRRNKMRAKEFLLEDDEQAIRQLVQKLTAASDAYYNIGKEMPVIDIDPASSTYKQQIDTKLRSITRQIHRLYQQAMLLMGRPKKTFISRDILQTVPAIGI